MNVEDFIPMAIKLAGQYRIDDDRGQPTEDSETYAEALIVADAAIKGYNDKLGVDLPGYVHLCIKRRLVEFRRVRNSRSRRLHLNTLQEDFSFDQLADLRPIETEHNESRVSSLREMVGPHHQKTFDLLYEAQKRGETQTQTFARLRKNSRQAWNNRVARLRNALAGVE